MKLQNEGIVLAESLFQLCVIEGIFIICLFWRISSERGRIENDFSVADLRKAFQKLISLSRNEITVKIDVGSRSSESLNPAFGASESLGIAGDNRLGRDENIGVCIVHRETEHILTFAAPRKIERGITPFFKSSAGVPELNYPCSLFRLMSINRIEIIGNENTLALSVEFLKFEIEQYPFQRILRRLHYAAVITSLTQKVENSRHIVGHLRIILAVCKKYELFVYRLFFAEIERKRPQPKEKYFSP